MKIEMTVSCHFAFALVRVLGEIGWSEQTGRAVINNALERQIGPVKPRSQKSFDSSAKSNPIGMRLPMSDFETLLATAGTALDDPLIGLRAGYAFRIINYGRTGAIYAFAHDLRDVIKLNAIYQKIAIDIGRVTYEQDEDDHMMVIRPHYRPEERETYRQVMAMLMASYGTAYQWLSWGSAKALKRVELPFSDHSGAAALAEDLFRAPVRFNCEAGRLVFCEKAAKQPIPTADPERRAIVIEKLEGLLGGEVSHVHFVNAVRAAMKAGLANGSINAASVADRLNMSDKALRARMKTARLTYQTELDYVRQDLLRDHYRMGSNFSVIAGELGYNDQAAFNRAVRRWYGVSPSNWTPQTLLKTAAK